MTQHRWVDYLLILVMIVLTVYGQMILKWRMDQLGPLPGGFWPALRHLLVLLVDPAIVSSFVAAFIASLAWMAAMTRFELSYAYPFTSLNFVVVLVLRPRGRDDVPQNYRRLARAMRLHCEGEGRFEYLVEVDDPVFDACLQVAGEVGDCPRAE